MDYTQLALLYGFCSDCRDPLMFWVGEQMKDAEAGVSICVECPMDKEK